MARATKLDVECAVSLAERNRLTAAEADAILEIVFLAMVADRLLNDEEADAFVRTMLRVLGPHASAARVRRIMERFGRRLERGERCVAARCARVDEVATKLRRKAARELAYKLAYVMSLSDLRTNESEFLFDQQLRAALRIDEARADELSDAAAGAVIGDGTGRRPTTCEEAPVRKRPPRPAVARRPASRRR
jgi:hypothetical protein